MKLLLMTFIIGSIVSCASVKNTENSERNIASYTADTVEVERAMSQVDKAQRMLDKARQSLSLALAAGTRGGVIVSETQPMSGIGEWDCKDARGGSTSDFRVKKILEGMRSVSRSLKAKCDTEFKTQGCRGFKAENVVFTFDSKRKPFHCVVKGQYSF